jgi:adenosylcobinamide-GDP ribazoletransferase
MSMIAAVRFLTRIPIPGPVTRTIDISRAIAWFPFVGAVIGLLTAWVYMLASHHWSPQISALLALIFSLMITGGLHEDGVADAADGLGGGWNPKQVIEIMRDSRIGAYGAMALWTLLMFRWITLMTLKPSSMIMTLTIAMAWGKWAIAVMLYFLPAISTGLADDVQRNMGRMSVLLASHTIILIMLTIYLMGFHSIWKPTITAIISTIAWIAYLKRRMGGQTGDLLGAGNQFVESAVLLATMAI